MTTSAAGRVPTLGCAAAQMAEYGFGARKRAVFFDVESAYRGKSFIFIQRGS